MIDVSVATIRFGAKTPLRLIAGPCQIESRIQAIELAVQLKEVCQRIGIDFIFKASFDKANRTSLTASRGVGLRTALPIFAEIKESFGIPVTTDVHDIGQCAVVAPVVDLLQIPALLCRQTDLLVAAVKTGRPVNVKKGQFLAPWDMVNVVRKLSDSGNDQVLVTERGTSFGYNRLIVDMRSLPIMAHQANRPVIFDATHSVQEPGGLGTSSGGQREHVPFLARAAVAAGVSGVFIETHHDPDRALSDGPNMIPIAAIEPLLLELRDIDALVKRYRAQFPT